LISREEFIKTLDIIKKGFKRREKFEKSVSNVSDSFFICNIGEEWLDQLVHLLEVEMNDEPNPKYGSMISWWLWEDVEKKIWWEEDGKKFERSLKTPVQLYNYLKERKVG
jgi:hypothetical protein